MERPGSYASSRPSSIMWSSTWPWPMRMPLRPLGSKCGALVMLSMPPATTRSWLPASSMSCASMVANRPEPHILDSVTAPVPCPSPPLNPACRAGAWPCPAIRQLPNTTWSMRAGSTPARATAAWMAAPPKSCAASDANTPWNAPMGVRAADRMTMGSTEWVVGMVAVLWGHCTPAGTGGAPPHAPQGDSGA